MKKSLLLSATLFMALGVSAQVVADWSPAAYQFNTTGALPEFVANQDGRAWNLDPTCWERHYKDLYKDGLVVINGSADGRQEPNYTTFLNSLQIVDLGGETGKVFALVRNDESVNDDIANATGLENPNLTTESYSAYYHLCWYLNPETPAAVPLRLTIECNFHSAPELVVANGGDKIMKAYINTDQIGVRPEGDNGPADTYMLTRGEFSKRFDEVNEGTRVSDSDLEAENDVDDNDMPMWNANRWLQYEFDFDIPEGDDKVADYGPCFIKMELPAVNNYTMFIRSIKLEQLSEDAEKLDNKRARVWNYYTVGTTAISEIADDNVNAPVEYFNLQGIKIANPENGGLYIKRQGNKATKVIL